MHVRIGIGHRNQAAMLGIGFMMFLFGLCGCQSSDAGMDARFPLPSSPPELGQGKPFEAGVLKYEVSLPHNGISTRLLLFTSDAPATKKRPCIFIAPAGTRLFHGSALDDGNPPEYLPYVHAGYSVVAYELDGDLSENPKDAEIYTAAQAFMKADGGLADARLAIDYALAKLPNIDTQRLYVAGHSSAATVALYVAEHEPRIKACIAYAPVCYLEERLPAVLINVLTNKIPGYRRFVHRVSPSTDVTKLACPVFLFHADDDTNVPTDEVARFADELKKTNKQVTFARVQTGNHYESMIEQGIPQAIEWLKKLPGS